MSSARVCATAPQQRHYGGHPKSGYDPTALPAVHNVHAQNITGYALTAASLKGLLLPVTSNFAMQNISFQDVNVASGNGWQCQNVWGGALGTPAACSCLNARTGCRA